MSSHFADFDARNKFLVAKLLDNTNSDFYRRHYIYDLISKFYVGLNSFLKDLDLIDNLLYSNRQMYYRGIPLDKEFEPELGVAQVG